MATKQEKLQETKQMLLSYWSSAKNNRHNKDWEWFNNELWDRGFHYAQWNKNTQQIMLTGRNDGTPKVVINLIGATTRNVANYVVRNQPKAEVTPVDLSEENVSQAVTLNKYLEYLHERLRLRSKLRASVKHSLIYSTGFWQVLWDENADDGAGEIAVSVVDPYDLYIDPLATDIGDAQFAILAVRRSLKDLKRNPAYKKADWDAITTTSKKAESSHKERLLNYEKQGSNLSFSETNDNVIVREFWYKTYDNDGNMTVNVATMVDEQFIREPEETDLTRLPFFRLVADRDPMAMYGDGWVKELIPINKEIDRIQSSIAEYNLIMNKVKWVAQKGSGINYVNNEHGQIITYKPGYAAPQPLTPSPMSAAIFQQEQMLNQYFEQIGGMHDASMGRIPPGAKSGRALEALQVGDSNNLAELVENVEIFLEDVYEYMLSIAAKKYQFARQVSPITLTGERIFVKVVGEDAEAKPTDAVVIRSKNIIDVQITSRLGNTPEARREAIKELAQILPDIDEQTILEVYGIGNIADIVQRMKQRREQKQVEQLAMEQQQQAMNEPQAGAQQAIAFIRQFVQTGAIPAVPEAVQPDFIAYFDQFLQSPEAQDLDPQELQTLQQVRDEATARVRQGIRS